MNVRKPTDYSAMFAALDTLMAANLPQMKLYCEIGRLVSSRTEKGAAVAAAEYLQGTYPDTTGFSPRNLRRMRDFYRTYESAPEVMTEAMTIGWTQNVVILEAELTLQEKAWYIQAVQQLGWSKLELARQIAAAAHLEMPLDLQPKVCYTWENSVAECMDDNKYSFYPSQEQSLQASGQTHVEVSEKNDQAGNSIPHRIRRCQRKVNQQTGRSLGTAQDSGTRHQLSWENGATVCQLLPWQIRPPDRNESGQPTEYIPYLFRRLCGQDAPTDEFTSQQGI